MDGASVLASPGVRSSLWQTNVQAVPEISPRDDPRWNMLFDPQTAGGLLAAVPADKAQTLIAELAAGGIPAAMIGHITKGAPFIRC
jgi:selenide, water dikinase